MSATVGLALTATVGVAGVTVALHEASQRPATAVTTAATSEGASPSVLRLWGLRVAPDGTVLPADLPGLAAASTVATDTVAPLVEPGAGLPPLLRPAP